MSLKYFCVYCRQHKGEKVFLTKRWDKEPLANEFYDDNYDPLIQTEDQIKSYIRHLINKGYKLIRECHLN